MSKGFKVTLVAIAAVVAVVIASISWHAMFPCRSTSSVFERYLCLQCAAKRDTVSRRFLGIPYDGSDKVTTTLLSRCMAGTTGSKCRHNWIRTYFDFHGPKESGHGGIGSRSLLSLLTDQQHCAAGIIKFANSAGLLPQEVWSTLFRYVANNKLGQPSMLDDAICSGRIFDQPFDDWLKENYLKLKQTSSDQVPEDTARNLADPQH